MQGLAVQGRRQGEEEGPGAQVPAGPEAAPEARRQGQGGGGGGGGGGFIYYRTDLARKNEKKKASCAPPTLKFLVFYCDQKKR